MIRNIEGEGWKLSWMDKVLRMWFPLSNRTCNVYLEIKCRIQNIGVAIEWKFWGFMWKWYCLWMYIIVSNALKRNFRMYVQIDFCWWMANLKKNLTPFPTCNFSSLLTCRHAALSSIHILAYLVDPVLFQYARLFRCNSPGPGSPSWFSSWLKQPGHDDVWRLHPLTVPYPILEAPRGMRCRHSRRLWEHVECWWWGWHFTWP